MSNEPLIILYDIYKYWFLALFQAKRRSKIKPKGLSWPFDLNRFEGVDLDHASIQWRPFGDLL
jgi:hypothetical protein